jgi:hypothetical protein
MMGFIESFLGLLLLVASTARDPREYLHLRGELLPAAGARREAFEHLT